MPILFTRSAFDVSTVYPSLRLAHRHLQMLEVLLGLLFAACEGDAGEKRHQDDGED